MKKEVIIALDVAGKDPAITFLKKFQDTKPYIKVGMELFYHEGPDIVREIKALRHPVFLDLKLHDIPHTVERAISALAKLGADIVNVHAAGTTDMMKAAMEGAVKPDGGRSMVIVVTQLTSTSQRVMNKDLLIPGALEQVVVSYAENAAAAGLDGVVCSPLESPLIHQHLGDDFITVTPGIRFATDAVGNQVRVTTPQRARQLGSDMIVVGRSITGAKDPVEAYHRCLREFAAEA